MENIIIALENALELLEGSENTQLIRAKNRLDDVIAIVKSSEDVIVNQDDAPITYEVPDTDVSKRPDGAIGIDIAVEGEDKTVETVIDTGADAPKTEGLEQA